MTTTKGPLLEELVRAYFSSQGFFSLRSVPYRYDGDDVTDIDVWLYSRQTLSVRVKGIVDVKNKKSPKAYERVLWVKGLQSALKCDKAVIATTDTNASLVKFARQQEIPVITKYFLERLEKKLGTSSRLTLEEFIENIQSYSAHKQDGDWLRVLADAKSAVASLNGFPAFNKAMFAFRFFSERAEVRTQNREQAIRCALLTAAISCIALDSAIEGLTFEDVNKKYQGLMNGVTYGDSGDGRVKQSFDMALSALAEGMQNGKAISAQARQNFDKRLSQIRAEIIAEYFSREHNAIPLFVVARELDEAAHSKESLENISLSIEARSILGVFADFIGVKRSTLPIGSAPIIVETSSPDEPTKQKDKGPERSDSHQNSLL